MLPFVCVHALLVVNMAPETGGSAQAAVEPIRRINTSTPIIRCFITVLLCCKNGVFASTLANPYLPACYWGARTTSAAPVVHEEKKAFQLPHPLIRPYRITSSHAMAR